MEALSQRRVINRLYHARHFFAKYDEEYSHVKMCVENTIELRAMAGQHLMVPRMIDELAECLGFRIDIDNIMGPDRFEFYTPNKRGKVISFLLKGQIDYVRR